MEIGEKIKQFRLQKKLSLREMGRRLNISYSYLSRVENGKQKPHLDLLESLASVLDVKVADFFIDESKSTFNETEKDLLSEKDLTRKYLEEKYGLEDATEQEFEKMVEYIKAIRLMKQGPNQ